MLRRIAHSLAVALALIAVIASLSARNSGAPSDTYEFNDAHFHLTNYIQEGIPIRAYLSIMGKTTGRSVLFGIPLQQQWSYRISGENQPTYYLDTDAPLYYYSFTDASIAMAYLSLSPEEQSRFDPMITGFNPTDMYAAAHIRRALRTFPGVFSGIGEFTIHKEFVSSKVAGGIASLSDPALDRVLDLAEEAGLVVLIHNDVDTPFANPEKAPAYLDEMRSLFRRHPRATIIWAHTGLGRIVRPIRAHAAMLEGILTDPELKHVLFDISWDEVAKYFIASPESLKIGSDLINRYPERFLFGTDVVAPRDEQTYLKAYHIYDPLWALLTTDAREMVRKRNYERIFDQARTKVRTWEAQQIAMSPRGNPAAQ